MVLWPALCAGRVLLTTFALTFSPDGRQLISAGVDRNIYVWDTRTWTARQFGQQHPEAVRSLALSPDGEVLATGGQDTTDNDNPAHLILWDPASGDELTRIRLPRTVTSVAFSPDGLWLAAATGEELMRLWRLSQLLECCEERHEDHTGAGGWCMNAQGRRVGVSARA